MSEINSAIQYEEPIGPEPIDTFMLKNIQDTFSKYDIHVPPAGWEEIKNEAQLAKIADGAAKYDWIKQITVSLSEEQREVLFKAVDEYAGGNCTFVAERMLKIADRYSDYPFGTIFTKREDLLQIIEKRQFLQHLFNIHQARDLDYIQSDFNTQLIHPEDLPTFFDQTFYSQLVESILESESHEFDYQIGALLTQLDFNQLSDKTREKLQPYMDESLCSLQMVNGKWWLCAEGEKIMQESLKNEMWTLVNDSILVMGLVKMTGLPLRNVTTESGATFLKGVFYSPMPGKGRRAIEDAIDKGETHVQIDEGDWVIMRQVSRFNASDRDIDYQTPESLLEQCQETVLTAGKTHTKNDFNGMSRQEYRKESKENHDWAY